MSLDKPPRSIRKGAVAVSLESKFGILLELFLITSVLFTAGVFYYRSEVGRLYKEKSEELAAIGQMKVAQVQRWRKERSDDSRRIADSPVVKKIVTEWLRDPGLLASKEDLIGRLQLEKDLGIYFQALLVSADQRILLSPSSQPAEMEAESWAAVKTAFTVREPVFSQLHFTPSGKIHVDIATAIPDAVTGQPLAVLVLTTDAAEYLFPMIEYWPTASAGGESFLVRQSGDQVLFLNELRFKKGTALNLHFPLAKLDLPAAQAVRGITGSVYGRDYRGVRVIADLRPVPGTDWYLETKENESELQNETRFRAAAVLLVVFFLVLGAAGIMAVRYRRLRSAELKITEKLFKDSEVRYRRLFEAAKDGILLLDAGTGSIMDVNPFLIDLLGYSREKFLGKKVWEIGFLKDVFANKENFLELQQKKYIRYEDLPLETADGRKIEVEFVSNVYLVEDHEVIQCNVRDVTARKEAEAKASKLQVQYQQLIENAKDGIFTIAPDGRFILANPAFCSLLGYSPEELFRINILDTYPEGTQREGRDRLASLAKGETLRFERPMKRKDGEVVFIDVATWKDQFGNVQAFIRDVTMRRQAEEALRESEERFRRFSAASGYGFGMGDLTGRCFFANAALLRIVEEAIEEDFIHKTFFHYYTPQDVERLKNEILPTVVEKDRWVGEIPLLSAKGRLVPTEQNIFLIFDEQGAPRMIGNIITDITERKRMEKELSELKETQFKTLLEALPSKVFLKDRNSVYLACNENYAGDLNVRPDEIVGRTDYDFFPTHLAEKYREDDRRIMDSGRTESWEEEYHVIGGYLGGTQESWINIVKAPVRDRAGNVTGLFGFFWDVTERRRMEIERQKVMVLKASAEMKSKFASMVSHELRSPLATIKGALSIVMDGLTGGINEEQRDVLDTAKRNIDRLGRLINNVLDFQKLDSGKMEFDIQANDLGEVVAEVHKSVDVLLSGQKGPDFRVELGEGLPKVRFDRDKLIQVLMNLVSNAIASAETGRVTLGVQKEKEEVHVRVQDTGPGIRTEDLGRLFQPFEQLDSGRGRKRGGTGLGLSICKEIILAHHGRIWAESVEGSGATFHVTLPL